MSDKPAEQPVAEWVIVPREPTEAMKRAGDAADYGAPTHRPASLIWGAMIAAAPAPVAQEIPREPTLGMLMAAMIASREHGKIPGAKQHAMPVAYEGYAAALIWRAMYDAALAQREP